jgi:carbon-monoxide dehydrogenase small subunit
VIPVQITVNGQSCVALCEPRRSLADFLRRDQGLTGTHLGCEHGSCGACTVSVDGVTARSCLMLAVQAHGRQVRTVEGLAPPGVLDDVQQAFWDHHGLQCGFCTPGMLMVVHELLAENPAPTEAEIRARIAGNLCRCTGYQHIVDAVLAVAARRAEADGARRPA